MISVIHTVQQTFQTIVFDLAPHSTSWCVGLRNVRRLKDDKDKAVAGENAAVEASAVRFSQLSSVAWLAKAELDW